MMRHKQFSKLHNKILNKEPLNLKLEYDSITGHIMLVDESGEPLPKIEYNEISSSLHNFYLYWLPDKLMHYKEILEQWLLNHK